jgi:hypothetical protein
MPVIQALRRLRQEDLEMKRPAWAMQRNPVSKRKEEKGKKSVCVKNGWYVSVPYYMFFQCWGWNPGLHAC